MDCLPDKLEDCSTLPRGEVHVVGDHIPHNEGLLYQGRGAWGSRGLGEVYGWRKDCWYCIDRELRQLEVVTIADSPEVCSESGGGLGWMGEGGTFLGFDISHISQPKNRTCHLDPQDCKDH